jgi:hypothetical protein
MVTGDGTGEAVAADGVVVDTAVEVDITVVKALDF